MNSFKALVANFNETTNLQYETKDLSFLVHGTVLIKTLYSSINYKDYLATKPSGNVAKINPLIPGIDAVGIVIEDSTNNYEKGLRVIVSGPQFGVAAHGGFSEVVSANISDVYPLPDGLAIEHAAILGTAGFTAMQSILTLLKYGLDQKPDARILVTGATGGVGSSAVYLLKKLGYRDISALTRQGEHQRWLGALGAKSIVTLEEIIGDSNKPLNTQKYDYIIDCVGGDVAASLLPFISYGGSISMCGHAAGTKFQTTVFPMILRGINILGIDSVGLSYQQKEEIWKKIADLRIDQTIEVIKHEILFEELKTELEYYGMNPHLGRIVVKY